MRHLLQPHAGARPDSTSALAHWKLDEASGNAVDSVGSYPLTATGSPGATGSLFAVPPGTTGARTFDGSTQYFGASGAPAAVSALTANHAISVVFKPDTVTGTQVLFCYTTASETLATNTLALLRLSGDELQWAWEYGAGTNVQGITSGLNLVIGTTYLATLVVDDASNGSASDCNVRLYVFEQGQGLIYEQAWDNETRAEGGTSSNFGIGYDAGNNSNIFDGTIDDVVLWTYPLTRDAALILYGETFGISYDEDTLYGTGAASYHLRVRVDDGTGTLRDLTDLAHSQDFVVGADISDDIDAPGASAVISIAREIDEWSLAHDVIGSPLNLLTGSYSALLELNRRILVDTAVIPQGHDPQAWDWVPLFEGYVSAVDWGAEQISIDATDKIGPLFDTFISKEPLEITSVDDSGTGSVLEITTGTAHGLVAGDKIAIYNTTNYNGQWTVATTPTTTTLTTVEAGTGSAAAETSGLLFGGDMSSYGSTGGTPVETVIQDIIDDNVPNDDGTVYGYIGGTPTLYTPSSPSFDILPYYQKREPVQTAIETLAAMIGWNVKYRWHDTVRDFRLTLYEPERTISTPQHTFTTDEIIEVTRASIIAKDIRNAVEVIYSDVADPDENGQARRVSVRRTDPTSIGKYGYRLCQIAEASTSQIDTYQEAVDLADAILSDLDEPKAEITVEMPFRRFVDLADYYRLPADGRHWDAAKDVAVVGYGHSFSDGVATTTLTLRGKPASANAGWNIRFVSPSFAPNQPTTSPIAPGVGPTLTPLAGGVDIYSPFPNDIRARNLDTVEIHISDVSGFTPSASSYRQISRGNRTRIFDLDPSKSHYVRSQFRDRFGNVSSWSPQTAVTPRYALNVPCTHVHLNGNQNIALANTPTTVEFDDVTLDTRSNFDAGTYSYTVPVDGVYSISCQLAVYTGKQGETAEVTMWEVGTPDVLLSTGTKAQSEDKTDIAFPSMHVVYHFTQGTELVWKVEVTNAGSDVLNGGASVARSHLSVHLVSQDD